MSSPLFEERLREDFLKIEDEILDATLGGAGPSSAEVVDRLSSLSQSLAYGIANRLLGSPTISMIRRIASNATTLMVHARELELRTRSVENKRQDELSALFARFSLNENDSQKSAHSHKPGKKRNSKPSVQDRRLPSTSTSSSLVRSPSEETLVPSDPEYDIELLSSHAVHGYNWLMKNTHNPYPTRQERVKIAELSGVALKTVDSWFVNVRRRIGWSALYNSRFRGSKALMVDTAFHVLELGESGEDPMHRDVSQDFLRIKSKLTQMYEDKFETSTHAKKLGETVARTQQSIDPSLQDTTCSRKRRRADSFSMESLPSRSRPRNEATSDTHPAGDHFSASNSLIRARLSDNEASRIATSPSGSIVSLVPVSPRTEPSAPVCASNTIHKVADNDSAGNIARKRSRGDDEGEVSDSKRARVDAAGLETLASPGLSPAIDCPLDLGPLWSLDFSMPTDVALDLIPDNDLDLSVYDWTSSLNVQPPMPTAPLHDIFLREGVSAISSPSTTNLYEPSGQQSLVNVLGDLLPGSQAAADASSTDPWSGYVDMPNSLSLPDMITGPLSVYDDISSTSSVGSPDVTTPYDSIDANVSLPIEPYIGEDTIAMSLMDVPSLDESDRFPQDYEALVTEILRTDRDVKLKRLQLLKEEKDRIAEEERRLHEDLNFPATVAADL